MNILILIANNPMMVVLGLMGLVLIVTAGWLGRAPKAIRQPVRIPSDRKK
jgi:fumarate reductase subunit C